MNIRGKPSISMETGQRLKLLLLLASSSLLLALAGNDLAKHDHTVAVHEGDAGETFAILEGVAHEWLLRLEGALSHFVGLQGVRVLHLLATGLLAHLPLECRDTARSTTTTDEADWAVSYLDLVRNVKDLDLSVELFGLPESRVLLVHHHVARTRHVLLVQTLDVQTDVVTRVGGVDTRVMHLHSEHLTGACVGGCVRRQEDNVLTRLDDTLLNTSGEDISDALDLVNARDWHAHRCADRALRHAAKGVEHIVESVDVDSLLAVLDVHTLPPVHLLRLLQQVVAHPAGDWKDWRALLNEVLFPADFDQHVLHLVSNLLVTGLLVASGVAVHLVHANGDLLHTKQVDQARVLASLALDFSSLVVALGNRRGEVTIGWDHDKGNVRLRCASDHVLDEVSVARRIDDGIMPLGRVEFLRGACNCHTTLTLYTTKWHYTI